MLFALGVAKPLANSSPIGPLLLTGVTIATLCIPLWRADRCGLSYASLGLHLRNLREDLAGLAWLALLLFPTAALVFHLMVSHGASWLQAAGWESLAALLPRGRLTLPAWPGDWAASAALLLSGLGYTATVLLVAALPEELFFRGYLQGQLERWAPPHARIFGVLFGRAACLAALLFALGHFLGEWNAYRLATFFPGLLFAWLYTRSGSIVGALLLHTLCNLFAELLFRLHF